MTEWVEDQDNVITNEALEQQSGPLGATPVDDVLERSEQVHVALLALTESESFDIVLGVAPSGLEALRRLVRRWDPLSGGKRRALLRHILLPDRCKLQDLPAGLEKWEELVRRYEKSKSSGTTTAALDEDIKTAALGALVPSELEQHLAMNRARLITYEQVRNEIQAYIEAHPSQFACKTVAAKTKEAKENYSRDRLWEALWTWYRLKHTLNPEGDTGAAISASPLDAKIGTETQANECSYKTASGELISARGGLRVQGKKEYWYGVTFQGRKADVHKTLISASKVHRKGHDPVVDSNGGCIILHNSVFASKIQQFVLNEIVNEPSAVRLYLENGTYIGYTKTQQLVRTRSHQELCSMHAKQQSGGFRPSRWGASPMASVGMAHSCFPAQSPETKAATSSGTLFFWRENTF